MMTNAIVHWGIVDSVSGFFMELYNSLFIKDYWKLYVEGLGNTLKISLIALVMGLVIGVFIACVKYVYATSGKLKILNILANFYTTIIRGTPVMLQILIAYYIIFKSLPSEYAIIIASVTFGINSGAYVSEIIRAGLFSVDKGQSESARSLGLSSGKTMRLIILPQAIRNILPSLFNEFIALVKETSVAGYVSIIDLTFAGDLVRADNWSYAPLIICAVIYLVIVYGLTLIQKKLEWGLAASDRG